MSDFFLIALKVTLFKMIVFKHMVKFICDIIKRDKVGCQWDYLVVLTSVWKLYFLQDDM